MRLGFTACLLVVALGCGRTAEPALVCELPVFADCDDLEDQIAAFSAAYADAIDDGDERAAIGVCAQRFTDAYLDDRCDAPCTVLCDLHPCSLADPAAGSCAEQCEATSIARIDLENAAVRAAGDPGFCSCAVCDEASAALCDAVWICP